MRMEHRDAGWVYLVHYTGAMCHSHTLALHTHLSIYCLSGCLSTGKNRKEDEWLEEAALVAAAGSGQQAAGAAGGCASRIKRLARVGEEGSVRVRAP